MAVKALLFFYTTLVYRKCQAEIADFAGLGRLRAICKVLPIGLYIGHVVEELLYAIGRIAVLLVTGHIPVQLLLAVAADIVCGRPDRRLTPSTS